MSVEISQLSNGLRVVTDRMEHLQTASLGVWVRAGARDEEPAQHGLSHLLEHMAFKGTERRTAREIAEEIENVGGDLNAATSYETTAFYARVLAEHVPIGLDMLADILLHSSFDETELSREKHVIVQEIGAARDDPEDLVHEMLQEAAFGDQTIGRSILGTADMVRAQTPGSLRGYLDRFYRPDAMVIAAAGAVDHDVIVRQAEDLFGGLQARPRPVAEAISYRGGERFAERDIEQLNLLIGVEGPSFLEPAFYTSRIAAAVLGGGMSSRLFQTIREEAGLCYSIYAFAMSFSDTGVFAVSASTGPEDTSELVALIASELERAAHDISEEEVGRARAQMKAGLLMSLESCAVRAEQIARQLLLLVELIPVDELVSRIEANDAARVRDLFGGLMRGGPVSVAAIGPSSGLESARGFAARLERGGLITA